MKNSAVLSFLLLSISSLLDSAVCGSVKGGSDGIVEGSNEGAATDVVCLVVGSGIYDTRRLSKADAFSYMSIGVAVEKACVCKDLCSGWSSFKEKGGRCTCLESGRAYSLWMRKTQQQTVDDDYYDVPGNDLGSCDDDSECDADTPCPSNQLCTHEDDDDCSCAPIPCASRFGNPCGPSSACTDTPTGYTCTAFILDGCPAGCGPASQCSGSIGTGFSCVCNPGFHRPIPYLGCVAL